MLSLREGNYKMTAQSGEYKSERIKQLEGLLGECMTAFATLRDEFHPPSDAYKLAEAFLQKIKAARGSNEQIP